MLVLENFSLYPLAHRLKSGYSSVLPVSVTEPPEGFSTVFSVTLAAEAAVANPNAAEPSASPDATATSTPRLSRAARIEVFTDFLPCVGVGVVCCLLWVWFGLLVSRTRSVDRSSCASPSVP